MPRTLTEQIAHFFQHYKDLEKGKWVTIARWVDTRGALRMVTDGIHRAAKVGDHVAAHYVAQSAMRRR